MRPSSNGASRKSGTTASRALGLYENREVYTRTSERRAVLAKDKVEQQKKRLTIPQSPKFSILSSQKNVAKIPRIGFMRGKPSQTKMEAGLTDGLKEMRSLSAGVSRGTSRIATASGSRTLKPIRPKSGPTGRF